VSAYLRRRRNGGFPQKGVFFSSVKRILT
jgi:hypothetical protein